MYKNCYFVVFIEFPTFSYKVYVINTIEESILSLKDTLGESQKNLNPRFRKTIG